MRRVHDASTREKSVSYPPSLAMRHQTSTHPQRFHLAHPPAADYTGPLSPYEEVSRLLQYCSIDDEEYCSALKHRLSRLANQIAEQNTRFMKRCWPAPAPGAKCCASLPPRRLRATPTATRIGATVVSYQHREKCPTVRCHCDGARRGDQTRPHCKQHFLYFFPLPQGHGSFLPTFR
jgi:hypothetical protein